MTTKYLKLYLFVCWAALIAKLLTDPMPGALPDLRFTYDDKFVHLALFGGFIFLLIEVIEAFWTVKYWRLVTLSLILSVGYSQLFEYLQEFIPGRTSSIYDTIAGALGALIALSIIYLLDYSQLRKPKLLLHICCIGCGAYVTELLKQQYRLTLFFYNPNIYPSQEYSLRLAETRRVAKELGIKVLVGKYDHQGWLNKVKGHEQDPEKGARCIICYEDRLNETAKLAKQLNYKFFTSTLTVSPHKVAAAISQLGGVLSIKYKVKFLDQDFKKNDGFKKSLEVSKRFALYRQNYCGCEFSMSRKTAEPANVCAV